MIGNVVTVSWAELSIYTVFTRTRNRAPAVTRALRGNWECENVCDQRDGACCAKRKIQPRVKKSRSRVTSDTCVICPLRPWARALLTF